MSENLKRYDMVNIFRMICAYLVIVIHTIAFRSFGDITKAATSDLICRIGVPFFFITSGYFFYSKFKEKGYVKNYIKKLVIIYIVVTAIYSLCFSPMIYANFIQMGPKYIIKTFLINGVSPSLWYFHALILSIIVVYLFLKNDFIKPLIIISAILLLIGLMGDSYFGLIKNTPLINIVNGYNFIFDNTRNGITFGVPFITIGALINKYTLNEKVKKPALLLGLFFIVYALEAYLLISRGIALDFNIYASLVFVVPLIFILALNSKVQITENTSNYFREMSLWIYAFHELIYILSFIFGIFTENSLLHYLFVCSTTTFVAFIISKIRLRKKLTSYNTTSKIIAISSLSLCIITFILIKISMPS